MRTRQLLPAVSSVARRDEFDEARLLPPELFEVTLYLEVFPDLCFTVEDQVVQGDRVASRWRLRGTHRGREVALRGIVISRFEGDRIIEDWAASDTLGVARQLGGWRSLLLLARKWRLLLNRG